LEGAKNRRSENSECHDWGAAKRVSNCDDRRDERNGSMKVLRKGSNDWTCVPDDPSSPGNDPMCLDPNAMEWLHAYVGKKPPPDKIGFIYMLQGGWDFSNLESLCDQARRQGHYYWSPRHDCWPRSEGGAGL
jgi:hypothetical protein